VIFFTICLKHRLSPTLGGQFTGATRRVSIHKIFPL